jgi:hypothetical protein
MEERNGQSYDLLDDDATWTIVGNSLVSRTYTSCEDFLSDVIRRSAPDFGAGSFRGSAMSIPTAIP